MTLYEPSLHVRRLRVERDGLSAYDEEFHLGVNIISGENSSGKSTILNFIHFALGGDVIEWSDEAKLCSRVMVEVGLNGLLATLSRSIGDEPRRPMEIISGGMELALNAPTQNWKRYPYARAANADGKESFSQTLFRLLDVPEAASEATGKLTMHQILRLHYADQLSPPDNLFKVDDRWDTPVLRDAIGRLLCGSEETKLLENRLRLRELDKQTSALEGELRAIFSAFGQVGENLTPEWVEAQKQSLIADLQSVNVEISRAEEDQLAASEDDFTLELQQTAYLGLENAQNVITETKEKRDSLAFGLADLRSYRKSISNKLDDLRNSEAVQVALGAVIFDTCPACFEPVIENDEYVCHLCKTPVQPERQREQMVAMVNELALQVRQTEAIIEKRQTELEVVNSALTEAKNNWQHAARELAELRSRPTSKSQARIRSLQSRKGYLERQIEEQDRKGTVADKVKSITLRKEELATTIERLRNENIALETAQEQRIATAYTAISDEIKYFLRNDLPRQKEFIDPRSVIFDFGANKISVNDSTYFSASSRAVLKTSFFVGFLFASLDHQYFRHLRICLIDTIEDKGMEDERSHNLQNLVFERSESAEVEHQIIYATAKISPQLKEKNLVVGKHYTEAEPSLDFAN
ncbi:AAA family ATPase [Anderseniella sp. Alg231-50]|uniref:AAA family ATPase n=1 Tax=Anderseniella sp. Alg231-50 TaxID=1922226 RepID=UPI000D55BA20